MNANIFCKFSANFAIISFMRTLGCSDINEYTSPDIIGNSSFVFPDREAIKIHTYPDVYYIKSPTWKRKGFVDITTKSTLKQVVSSFLLNNLTKEKVLPKFAIFDEINNKYIFIDPSNTGVDLSLVNLILDKLPDNHPVDNYYNGFSINYNIQDINKSIGVAESSFDSTYNTNLFNVGFSFAGILTIDIFVVVYGNDSIDPTYNFVSPSIGQNIYPKYYIYSLYLPFTYDGNYKANSDNIYETTINNFSISNFYYENSKYSNNLNDFYFLSLIPGKEIFYKINPEGPLTSLNFSKNITAAENMESVPIGTNKFFGYSPEVNNFGFNTGGQNGFKDFYTDNGAVFSNNNDTYCTIDVKTSNVPVKVCFHFDKDYLSFSGNFTYSFNTINNQNPLNKLGIFEFLNPQIDSGIFLTAKNFLDNFYPAIYNVISNFSTSTINSILSLGTYSSSLGSYSGSISLPSINFGRLFVYKALKLFVEDEFAQNDKKYYFNKNTYSNLKAWVLNNFYFSDLTSLSSNNKPVVVLYKNNNDKNNPNRFILYSYVPAYDQTPREFTLDIPDFNNFNDFISSLNSLTLNYLTQTYPGVDVSSSSWQSEDMMFLTQLPSHQDLSIVRNVFTHVPLVSLKNNSNALNEFLQFLSDIFNYGNKYSPTRFFSLFSYFGPSNINSDNEFTSKTDIISINNNIVDFIPPLDLPLSNYVNNNIKPYILNSEYFSFIDVGGYTTYLSEDTYVYDPLSVRIKFKGESFSKTQATNDASLSYPVFDFIFVEYLPIVFKDKNLNLNIKLNNNDYLSTSQILNYFNGRVSLAEFSSSPDKSPRSTVHVFRPYVFNIDVINPENQDLQDLIPATFIYTYNFSFKNLLNSSFDFNYYLPCYFSFLSQHLDICIENFLYNEEVISNDQYYINKFSSFSLNVTNYLISNKNAVINELLLDINNYNINSDNSLFISDKKLFPHGYKFESGKTYYIIALNADGDANLIINKSSGFDTRNDPLDSSTYEFIRPVFLTSTSYCYNLRILDTSIQNLYIPYQLIIDTPSQSYRMLNLPYSISNEIYVLVLHPNP
jgi:hypothetical protein